MNEDFLEFAKTNLNCKILNVDNIFTDQIKLIVKRSKNEYPNNGRSDARKIVDALNGECIEFCLCNMFSEFTNNPEIYNDLYYKKNIKVELKTSLTNMIDKEHNKWLVKCQNNNGYLKYDFYLRFARTISLVKNRVKQRPYFTDNVYHIQYQLKLICDRNNNIIFRFT